MRRLLSLAACVLSIFTTGLSLAQERPVPRLVQFNGVLKTNVQLVPGIRGLTFALYREQQGGPPLWQETQNVIIDAQGRFGVLLGAGTNGGLPVELFTAADSQWLGVQTDNSDDSEQDRVLLVSVPYALKAADADTLAGKPLSAFVLTDGLNSRDQKSGKDPAAGGMSFPLSTQDSGTPNTIPKYAGTGNSLANSSITDDGTNVSAITEPVFIKTLNNVRLCDQFAGANAGAKIAACIADLPSTGGVADARGLNGAQSVTSDPFNGVTKPVHLIFGCGDYELTHAISPTSGSVIEGSGYCSRIKSAANGWTVSSPTNFALINLNGVTNVRVSKLRLYGTKTQDQNHTPKLIYLYGSSYTMIDHNWFENMAYEGIWSSNTPHNVTVEANQFYDVGASSVLPALQLNADDAVIANNILRTVGSGIGASGSRMTVTGNYIRDALGDAIGTGDAGDDGLVSITGNVVVYTAGTGQTNSAFKIGFPASGSQLGTVNVSGNACYMDSTSTPGRCYRVGGGNVTQRVKFVGNTATMYKRGNAYEVDGDTAAIQVDFTGNAAELISPAFTSNTAFTAGIGSGAITVHSSGNVVRGYTIANSDYAYRFSATNVAATLSGDVTEDGYVFVNGTLYTNGEFNNVPIFLNTSPFTRDSQYTDSIAAGMLRLAAPYTAFDPSSGTINIAVNPASQPGMMSRINVSMSSGNANLNTINGGRDGDVIILSTVNIGGTLTVKDGTGNIECGTDFAMVSVRDRMTLMYDASISKWVQLARSAN